MQIDAIAHIRSEFPEKFGIPRQSGLATELLGKIVFEPQYRNSEALRGLEDFDYIWLIWEFSANRRDKKLQPGQQAPERGWQPTVRPPRLGGNKSMGVFATRSPFRPNPLGLSAVQLDHIETDTADGPVIWVRGADLMDGTPIYDIKPYITYADSHGQARSGYVDSLEERHLDVSIPEKLASKLDRKQLSALRQVLELDPRPSYQNDPDRIYGLSFGKWNVHFNVNDKQLTVTDIL